MEKTQIRPLRGENGSNFSPFHTVFTGVPYVPRKTKNRQNSLKTCKMYSILIITPLYIVYSWHVSQNLPKSQNFIFLNKNSSLWVIWGIFRHICVGDLRYICWIRPRRLSWILENQKSNHGKTFPNVLPKLLLCFINIPPVDSDIFIRTRRETWWWTKITRVYL